LLELPADWNLSAYRGTAGKGSIGISDLQGPRLAVRWRKSREPAAEFHALAQRLRARQGSAQFQPLGDNSVHIQLGTGEQLLLAHDRERLFELHWQTPVVEGFMRSFCAHLRAPPAAWHWEVFGIRGSAPPFAVLKSASLRAGAPRITLTARRFTVTFGAVALADRFLRGTDLRSAMGRRLKLNNLEGEWSESDSGVVEFTGRRKILFAGVIPFQFQISHDPAANLIRWQLTTRPAFHRIWRPE
ncbi:MAG TPA: hypothetical protein VHM90_08790, partial [Phycisphaerae bacterium]|nr:hypothetical protein [Phycisphaerae bacterium]